MLIPDIRAIALEPTFEDYKKRLQPVISFSILLPEAIQQEKKKLYDLLELCYFKYDLFDLAQLYAVMVFEKAMRLKLETEYKNISKIKLSVLLDRAKQLKLLEPEQVLVLRTLKDFRNRGVHVTAENTDAIEVLLNVRLLMDSTDNLFSNTIVINQ